MALLGCVVAGLLTAVAGLPVSRAAAVVGSSAWPWGLALAVVGAVAVFAGGSALAGLRGLVAAGAGWLAPIATLAIYHPGGDDILGRDWTGLVYVGVGVLVLAFIGIRAWARSQPAARPRS